ncbi:MAG: hypothetical protein DKM50_01970 [Candidatus Margulisiibacteriota bacterium]|nr:MAG: hypothetical protein A2X43_13175 [Candidatus Margulisbacteria bacterium GWD2_39_127]PZM83670.1 MAG: hypothetical protein DKM50_01970 [Candidatus Margulisiibacteriota bacterium]HAR62088.1 hypothetical protein [Candidatus Margulisiibacteriota bacterium]HCY36047.1 hypothetical protein [Candidatus Margulisiibacteriota bacterium]
MKKIILIAIAIVAALTLINGCSKITDQTGIPDTNDSSLNSQQDNNFLANINNDTLVALSGGINSLNISDILDLDKFDAGLIQIGAVIISYPYISSVIASPSNVDPGGTTTITVTPSDKDKNRLTYAYLPAAGSIVFPLGQAGTRVGKDLIGTPNVVVWTLPNTPGTYEMKIIGTNGPYKVLRRVYATVNTPADKSYPVINSVVASPVSVNVGESSLITVIPSDKDKDRLTYTYMPSAGSISFPPGQLGTRVGKDLIGTPNVVVWTPPDIPGTYEMRIIGNNGFDKVLKKTQVTVYTIQNNDQPVINDLYLSSQDIQQGDSVTLTVLATDPDNDTLSYNFLANGTITQTNSPNVVTWMPSENIATQEIIVFVSDGSHTVSKNISLTIQQKDYPPQISSVQVAPATIFTGQTTVVTVEARDPGGEALSYTFNGPGTIDNSPTINIANWTPPSIAGEYIITVTVSDEKSSITTTASIVVQALPQTAEIAFPGAEGFGAKTRGAFSGPTQPEIYHVTNLNDRGPGSFRNAFKITGPLLIVFETGGIITLTEEISIDTPYITIAGQTAPGGGICIKGAPIRIKSHDIIVRGLRIRNGNARTSSNDENGDGLAINAFGGHTCPHGPPYNIIIDHCSISWCSNENTEIWYAAHNITWQWNIISEPIWDQNYRALTGYPLLIGDSASNISIHHNLFAHYKQRGPECNDGTSGEIVNNIMYHWTHKGTNFIGAPLENPDSGFYEFQPSYWNIIKNYYKRKGTEGPKQPIQIFNYPGWNNEYYIQDTSRFYLYGNIGPDKTIGSNGSDLSLVAFLGGGDGSSFISYSHVVMPSGISEDTAEHAYNEVLGKAGARTPQLDTADERVINDVIHSTGALKTSISASDYPVYESGTKPADSDNDSLPDSFEKQYGTDDTSLTPYSLAPSGYTWIEEYINSLIK